MARPSKRGRKATGVTGKARHRKAELRYKEIKKYVDFKFKDDDATAKRIKTYYDILWPVLRQPHTTYRSNSKKNIQTVAKNFEIGTRRKYLKAVPVPNSGVDDLSVRVNKGKVIVSSRTLTTEYIPFNKLALARSGATHVNRLIGGYAETDYFKIQTGDYEMASPHTRDLVAAEVARLQNRYEIGNEIVTGKAGHVGRRKITRKNSWRKWLNGVVRLVPTNQVSPEEYKRRIATREKMRRTNIRKTKGRKI